MRENKIQKIKKIEWSDNHDHVEIKIPYSKAEKLFVHLCTYSSIYDNITGKLQKDVEELTNILNEYLNT